MSRAIPVGRLAATVAAWVALVGVAGCGGDDDVEGLAERLDRVEERLDALEGEAGGGASIPSGPDGPGNPDDGAPSPDDGAPPPAADDPATEALVFFRSQESLCEAHAAAIGNPPVEPSRFAGAAVTGMAADGTLTLVDGAGTSLLVVLEREIVTGPDGDGGVIPAPYAFSCPEDVFVGLLPE